MNQSKNTRGESKNAENTNAIHKDISQNRILEDTKRLRPPFPQQKQVLTQISQFVDLSHSRRLEEGET
jgi:hypothetical protein